jgi:splicing factor 3B subunit 2
VSDELKAGLGMPEGAPPPWLINMQRYGPPPSYPNLKIQGLNAPIPEGAQFGYHPGGWGKPPVDEFGRPLYGDVFGTQMPHAHASAVPVRQHLHNFNVFPP